MHGGGQLEPFSVGKMYALGREGYSSCFVCASVCVCVCVCVCVYVCYHASCYVPGLYIAIKVPLGFLWHFKGTSYICIVLILLKTLRSKVLATFSDHHGLLRLLMSSLSMKETAMASFQY